MILLHIFGQISLQKNFFYNFLAFYEITDKNIVKYF